MAFIYNAQHIIAQSLHVLHCHCFKCIIILSLSTKSNFLIASSINEDISANKGVWRKRNT